MRLPLTALLLLLGSHVLPSDASAVARGTESIAETTHRLHRRAAHQSADLAKNLRRVFATRAATNSTKRAVCKPKPKSGNGDDKPLATFQDVDNSKDNDNSETQKSPASGPSPKPTSNANGAASPWKIKKTYQGKTFFDGWTFFTDPDPTNGIVDYVDRKTAQSSNLIDINDAGNAIMRVETTQRVSGNRKSVRITTEFQYTGALILMDAVHMPTGCGTWPAFWSNGPKWPSHGEIDILEGVNDYYLNQASVHTSSGCRLADATASKLGISGTLVGGNNCAAYESRNQGCGTIATQSNTYGDGFNNNRGGVYAMEWDTDGISVYFFARDEIPDDIKANAPLPDKWGVPMARWAATHCDPFNFFSKHHAIFDTTLCGDWAGNVWESSREPGEPNQKESCKQRTGVPTCEDYVRQNGGKLREAYWEVSYVKIFQKQK